MIAIYFVLIALLLYKHILTPWGAGAFAAMGFAVWLFTQAVGAV